MNGIKKSIKKARKKTKRTLGKDKIQKLTGAIQKLLLSK